MSHNAITVTNVSKLYRLYRRRASQLLAFLSPRAEHRARGHDEFWALRDVSFRVAKGTTLGIVGRNGAGKSTLLKLLAGASVPTSGDIQMHGRPAALLDLGTGFHPDLTGHENIFACGLYLGLTRREIDGLYDKIVSFAELGPFLHQPVRTYSAGMHMRLAFAVATAQAVDIQVIDEVLGVGDAYFFGKCLRRLRQFQEEGGTTIIVSHDHAALMRLCTRCLWMDQGKIVADGPPLEVISAYTQSVYEEQDRLPPSGSSLSGVDLVPAYVLRTAKAIVIQDVRFADAGGRRKQQFEMGEPVLVCVSYTAQAALEQAVVSLGIYGADGQIVANAISLLDGVTLPLTDGQGLIELTLDPLNLGPGEYLVSVGIYPTLDLQDPTSLQHAVIWHRSTGFRVSAPSGVALNLGVCRQPVQWRVFNPHTGG